MKVLSRNSLLAGHSQPITPGFWGPCGRHNAWKTPVDNVGSEALELRLGQGGEGGGEGCVWWFGLEFFQPKGSFLRKLGRWSKEAKGVWRQKSCAGFYTFCDLFRAIFYLFVAENPTFSWFTELLKPARIWKITQYIYYWWTTSGVLSSY